jgi:type 1 glutamine amidotransferase
VVILHSATIADKDPEKLADRIGLSSQPGPTNYRHTPLDLKFAKSDPGSISEGFKELHLLDEPYWPMFGDTNRVNVLAAAEVDGASRPLIWTYTPGKGRVFASIPCHYTWTWSDPVFRALLFRGIAWAAGEPPQRFDPVAGHR